MLNFSRAFTQGARWNALDSLITQGLLVGHHMLVRSCMGIHFHGQFGTLLSSFYLALVFVNMGLDLSLGPFINYFSQSRAHAHVLFSLVLTQWLIVSCCLVLACWQSPMLPLPEFMRAEPLLIFVLTLALISESIKKTFKVFLQLTLYTPVTALTEVIGMLVYCLGIWAWYLITGTLSLTCSFATLLCVSLVQASILSLGVLHWHRQLPPVPHHNYHNYHTYSLATRMIKARIFTGGNQLVSQLFSVNFLVSFFAFRLGVESASALKIASSIAQWITLVAHKIFGMTGMALLSQTKNVSLTTKKEIFTFVTHRLHQVLYALLLILVINRSHIFTVSSDINLLLFTVSIMSMSFIEGFLALYEKWYIIEEKSHVIFSLNSLCALILAYALICLNHTPSTVLMLMAGARLILYCALTLSAAYTWQLHPSWSLEKRTVGAALILASILYYSLLLR